MKWCEHKESVCAGTDRRKVAKEALRLLKVEHGTGLVNRGQAMCSVKITVDDVEVVEIPFMANAKNQTCEPKKHQYESKTLQRVGCIPIVRPTEELFIVRPLEGVTVCLHRRLPRPK